MNLAGTVTPGLTISDETEQTRTYKISENKIQGFTDGMDALKQAIFHMLGTERFEYPVYSLDYGLRTDDLMGKGQTSMWKRSCSAGSGNACLPTTASPVSIISRFQQMATECFVRLTSRTSTKRYP